MLVDNNLSTCGNSLFTGKGELSLLSEMIDDPSGCGGDPFPVPLDLKKLEKNCHFSIRIHTSGHF